MFQSHSEYLINELGLEVYKDTMLSEYTTFKIGGKIDLLIHVCDTDEIKKAVDFVVANEIPYFVMGAGSNLLITDSDLHGAVIIIKEKVNKKGKIDILNEDENEVRIKVSSSVMIKRLIGEFAQTGLSELYNISSIPGTIGGGIKSNAGIDKLGFSKITSEITCLNKLGACEKIKKDKIGFRYRGTSLSRENIILDAELKFSKINSKVLKDKIRSNMKKRMSTQPYFAKSAGCVFKNLENISAGELIDSLGMKNLSVGDAMVSNEHANFIINKSKATFSDVVGLIELIKGKVFRETGISLQEELVIKEGI
ncbi:MAG: UDP-N-acetylmuramate dehydrogenase [Pseudomonadota bacterium]